MEMILKMKIFEAKRILITIIFISFFILCKRFFVFGKLDSVHECLYYYFFYIGDKNEKLNIRLISDFVFYQSMLWLFMGCFFKEDILDNVDLIFTRVKKKIIIYLKEIKKIIINLVAVYMYIYMFCACLCVKSSIVNIFTIIELEYFIVGLLLICLFFCVLNIGAVYMDVRYICILSIIVGFYINRYFAYPILICILSNIVVVSIELIFINKKELIFWKQ